MAIFDDGPCDNALCDGGKAPMLDTKTWEYDNARKTECPSCLGTSLKLTLIGEELVQFLRQIHTYGKLY